MIREVNYNGTIIKYNLTTKRVKNINLRIKPDCTVEVSANYRVSKKYIDSFVIKKGDFILKAFEEFNKKTSVQKAPKYSEDEFRTYVFEKFTDTYNLFTEYKIKKPQLKFRKMKSRWGSCNYVKFIIIS